MTRPGAAWRFSAVAPVTPVPVAFSLARKTVVVSLQTLVSIPLVSACTPLLYLGAMLLALRLALALAVAHGLALLLAVALGCRPGGAFRYWVVLQARAL